MNERPKIFAELQRIKEPKSAWTNDIGAIAIFHKDSKEILEYVEKLEKRILHLESQRMPRGETQANLREWWLGYVYDKAGIIMDSEPGDLGIHFKKVFHVREIPPQPEKEGEG